MFKIDTTDTKTNRDALYKNNNLSKPLCIYHKDKEHYWCFGCHTCFKNIVTAENHFEKKRCLERHKENLLALRDKYPKDLTPIPKGVFPQKGKLEYFLTAALERVRFLEKKFGTDKWDYEAEYGQHFEDWGMSLSEKDLHIPVEDIPPSSPQKDDVKPEVKEEKPTVETVIVEEEAPLVFEEPKRLTQREVMLKNLEDPEVDEGSKNALRKILGLPLKETAPPPPPPPPAPSEPLEIFKKLSPWERFLQANPHYSLPEALMAARNMGIQPDTQYKLISNTKAKRVAKKTDC